jgi:hypothetical protein
LRATTKSQEGNDKNLLPTNRNNKITRQKKTVCKEEVGRGVGGEGGRGWRGGGNV